MTRNELIEKIQNGSDIMFDVGSRHFTIVTWLDDGIGIGEQHPNDGEIQAFPTAESLVDNFRIDDKSLAQLCDKIVITDYS